MQARPRRLPLIAAALLLLAPAGCRHHVEMADMEDPCSLFTDDDVREVLKPLTKVTRKPDSATIEQESGEANVKICNIGASTDAMSLAERGYAKLLVFNVRYVLRDEFQRERAKILKRFVPNEGRIGTHETESDPAQPLPGIADEAFWNPGTKILGARKGFRGVLINGIDDLAAGTELARRAVARLP